jgi:site-specific DNA-methyltransferase (adenine-specific)
MYAPRVPVPPTAEEFPDGLLVHADCTSAAALDAVRAALPDGADGAALVIADPPYGNVIHKGRNAPWDATSLSQHAYADATLRWLTGYADLLRPGGALYCWGGYGRPGFRPFFEVLARADDETPLTLANLITWSKRRARGTPHNYLQTREDLAYFTKGDPRRPAVFNVPLTDVLRGYPGYNPRYPAKSPYLRRTSVWTDVTEILRGKTHPAEKPARLAEIMISTSTDPGDTVVDPFAGSGSTAAAVRSLNAAAPDAPPRRFVLLENDPVSVRTIRDRLRWPGPPTARTAPVR